MQFVTAEDPAGELESDGQGIHVKIDVALTTVEYVDALQSMQSDSASLLSVSRYVPGGQLRHVVTDDEPWMNEYLPAAHAMQSDSASLLSVSRYVPGGQLAQVEAPAPLANVPATQFTQLEAPTVANFPASQILQFVPTCSYPARQVKMVQLASQDVSHPPQP